MDKPVLKQIDILVFPSFGGNLDLKTSSGAKKFEQWIKQVELAGKRKDTAFIIVPDLMSKNSSFSKNMEYALKRNLPGSHFYFNSDAIFNPKMMEENISSIKKLIGKRFNVGEKVLIKRFGQHAPDACIETYGRDISSKLSDVLKKEGALVSEKAANGLSVKFGDLFLLKSAQKRMGANTSFEAEKEVKEAIRELLAKRKFNSVGVAHAIRRSASMDQVAQNLKGLAARKVKRK